MLEAILRDEMRGEDFAQGGHLLREWVTQDKLEEFLTVFAYVAL